MGKGKKINATTNKYVTYIDEFGVKLETSIQDDYYDEELEPLLQESVIEDDISIKKPEMEEQNRQNKTEFVKEEINNLSPEEYNEVKNVFEEYSISNKNQEVKVVSTISLQCDSPREEKSSQDSEHERKFISKDSDSEINDLEPDVHYIKFLGYLLADKYDEIEKKYGIAHYDEYNIEKTDEMIRNEFLEKHPEVKDIMEARKEETYNIEPLSEEELKELDELNKQMLDDYRPSSNSIEQELHDENNQINTKTNDLNGIVEHNITCKNQSFTIGMNQFIFLGGEDDITVNYKFDPDTGMSTREIISGGQEIGSIISFGEQVISAYFKSMGEMTVQTGDEIHKISPKSQLNMDYDIGKQMMSYKATQMESHESSLYIGVKDDGSILSREALKSELNSETVITPRVVEEVEGISNVEDNSYLYNSNYKNKEQPITANRKIYDQQQAYYAATTSKTVNSSR